MKKLDIKELAVLVLASLSELEIAQIKIQLFTNGFLVAGETSNLSLTAIKAVEDMDRLLHAERKTIVLPVMDKSKQTKFKMKKEKHDVPFKHIELFVNQVEAYKALSSNAAAEGAAKILGITGSGFQSNLRSELARKQVKVNGVELSSIKSGKELFKFIIDLENRKALKECYHSAHKPQSALL